MPAARRANSKCIQSLKHSKNNLHTTKTPQHPKHNLEVRAPPGGRRAPGLHVPARHPDGRAEGAVPPSPATHSSLTALRVGRAVDTLGVKNVLKLCSEEHLQQQSGSAIFFRSLFLVPNRCPSTRSAPPSMHRGCWGRYEFKYCKGDVTVGKSYEAARGLRCNHSS